MVTFNTSTGTTGHLGASDNFDAPTPKVSAADKSAGSIEIRKDGSTKTSLSINQKSGTVDSSTNKWAQMEASKAGPLNGPITFIKKRSGLGGTVADAEANPKDYMFAQGGTRVSLQTALNSGLVKKHGNDYYDFRVDPASFKKG